MASKFLTTFSNAFSWLKFCFRFHWSLFPKVQLTIFQHRFRWWLGADQVTGHCLNQCWPISLTHICGIRGKWVKRQDKVWGIIVTTYLSTSNIRRTLVGNKIVDHSDVVGASPAGAAPTTSSFSTYHLASSDSAKTAGRQYENLLSVGIWCVLY